MEKVIHIIPTPIGNLEDITLRAIRLLNNADLILAEDTRVTKRLLSEYNITTTMSSYHSFNEHKVLKKVITQINDGKDVVLVSDAGTPGISDPGFLLVRECIKANINVICLPGPTACIPALIQSGIPCERFVFEGFLPVKKGRKKRLLNIVNEEKAVIIYESPHRILKTLKDLSILCKDRQIVVLKELTKLYETTYRGDTLEIIQKISESKIKGEFIIIINGKE